MGFYPARQYNAASSHAPMRNGMLQSLPLVTKGRWHGEAVTEGLRSRALKIGTYSGESAEIITFA